MTAGERPGTTCDHSGERRGTAGNGSDDRYYAALDHGPALGGHVGGYSAAAQSPARRSSLGRRSSVTAASHHPRWSVADDQRRSRFEEQR